MQNETHETPDSKTISSMPIVSGDAISLADACRMLPARGGKQPSPSAVRRWVGEGVKGPTGNRVRLRAFRIGRTWFTRVEWVKDFISACTDGFEIGGDVASPFSPCRSSGLAETRRRLAARGFYGPEKKNEVLGLR